MSEWEKNVRKVVPYVPGEQPKLLDVIKLNTNENPYPPAPGVEKVLREFDVDTLRLYPDPLVSDLVKAIADFYGLNENQVFTGVGSDDVLAMIFMTFFNSEKPLIFPDITYSFYDVWADMLRIPYETIALDDDFRIKPKDYYRENGGVIFPNPNAPTGELLSLDMVEDIIKQNSDVIVVVDEAYIDFGGVSALPLIEKYDNLIVVQTFSKSRSLAGSRVGYAMANPAKVIKTREWTKNELAGLGFEFGDSKSNFIFARHPKMSGQTLFEKLKAEQVFVRHFSKPERIADYLRISIGTDQQMQKLISILERIL